MVNTSLQVPLMPDHTLHGNHDRCEACELRREAHDTRPFNRAEVPCNACNGVGWLPLNTADIVRRTVEEARRCY